MDSIIGMTQFQTKVMTTMESVPLVSVVVITYNHARYIRHALDSVLCQQTSFDIEILIGEDESSDGTREIVTDYMNRFPGKIIVIYHQRKDVIYINGRPSGAYNYFDTLARARGKYIAYLDGDDYWTDSLKLQKQVDIMEMRPDLAMCAHWVANVDQDGLAANIKSCTGLNCPREFSTSNALSSTPVHPNSWLFRRFDVQSHPAYRLIFNLSAGDDSMALVLLSMGNGYCIPEVMSAYRLHNGGTWSAKSRITKNFEMLQFRVVLPSLIKLNYLHFVIWKNSYYFAVFFWQLAKIALSKSSRDGFRELISLYRSQSILKPTTLLGWCLAAALLAPFHVAIFAIKRISLIARRLMRLLDIFLKGKK